MTEQHHEDDRNPEIRFEETDVQASAILKFGVYLLGATIGVLLLMQWLYVRFARFEAGQQPAPPIMQTAPDRKPPLPRLQEHPTNDLVELRAREDHMLGSYAWVDKDAGIVRIPIDEAMRITAERGLPVRGAETAQAPAPAKSGAKR
jgi:hypothetical protein